MNATELHLQDGRSAGIFFCGECRRVARTQDEAEQCCRPRLCACGKELEKGWTLCTECRHNAALIRESERFRKAEKIPEAQWSGWVYCGDECYPDTVQRELYGFIQHFVEHRSTHLIFFGNGIGHIPGKLISLNDHTTSWQHASIAGPGRPWSPARRPSGDFWNACGSAAWW